jgi:hypothetical protein
MLDQEDLKNIGAEVGKVIEQNVNPAIESLREEMATKEDLVRVEKRLDHVENQMVTKDYLDEKLAENYGNLVVLMRKGDVKLLRLVELLKKKAVISEDEVKELLAMEPFPKLAL